MTEGQAEIGDLVALATIRRILLRFGHQLQPEPPRMPVGGCISRAMTSMG
jgi:hypothetical protein